MSTGQNQPINADALSQVLGHGQLGADRAAARHSRRATVAGGLASVLPQVIDKMTPQGQVPDDHHDIVAQALALLTQKTA